MSTDNPTETGLPPWAGDDEGPPMYSRQRHPEPEYIDPAPAPRAAKPSARKNTKKMRAPESGEWEVQVRTGGSGRGKWGWLQTVHGMQPDKAEIRDRYGAGHYRIIERGGFATEFTIARLPADWAPSKPAEREQEGAPGADLEDIGVLIDKTVKMAVHQAMTSTINSLRPFLESLKQPASQEENEALQRVRGELVELSTIVRSLAASPRPAEPQGPSWQQNVIERVMAAGLANMGIDDEDDEPDTTERLLEMGTALVSGLMTQRGAAVQPTHVAPARPAPSQHQAPAQQGPPPTLSGMTPEIEAELRAYSAKIGYDYDDAIAEASAKGATAEALLEQCRELIGPLGQA